MPRSIMAVVLAAAVAFACSTLRGESAPTKTPHHFYATRFPVAENPISENKHWINGAANGRDWADVRTSPGLGLAPSLER